MKRLFLQVYGVVMGSLLLGLLTLNYFNQYFYATEIEDEYLNRATMLTQAIQRDIAHGIAEADSLAWWRQQLHDKDEIELEIHPRQTNATQASIKKISVTEAEDVLEVTAPFDATRALHFIVHDLSAPGAIWVYYLGYVLLYLFLGALLYVLTHTLYRHIDAIRQHAKRVAQGDYLTPLLSTRIAAFKELREDLNHMMQSLSDKTHDNHVLTAAIHHELRTPLTRLRLALDMALATTRPQEAVELLHDMDTALDALSDLMEDVLTLSRLRLNQQPAPRAAVQLDQLLITITEACHDARLHVSVTPCSLYANRALLERALNNFLDNARKYAREHIAIALKSNGHQIELSISDDGPGIPEKDRERAKQAFVQVKGRRLPTSGGVGLGLAIADLALKDSEALWSIESSQWGGATILIRWQVEQEAPALMS